jgi:hypothetical protein
MSRTTRIVSRISALLVVVSFGVALADAQGFTVTSQSRHIYKWAWDGWIITENTTVAPDGGESVAGTGNWSQNSRATATGITGLGSAHAYGDPPPMFEQSEKTRSVLEWHFNVPAARQFTLVGSVASTLTGGDGSATVTLTGPSASASWTRDHINVGTTPLDRAGTLLPGDYTLYAAGFANSSQGSITTSYDVTLTVTPEPTSALALLLCAALAARRR